MANFWEDAESWWQTNVADPVADISGGANLLTGEGWRQLGENLGSPNTMTTSAEYRAAKSKKSPQEAITELLTEAEKKKIEDDKKAAEEANRFYNQVVKSFTLQKTGALSKYQMGGTVLTSPLGSYQVQPTNNSLIGV